MTTESAGGRGVRPDLIAVLEDGGYRITAPRAQRHRGARPQGRGRVHGGRRFAASCPPSGAPPSIAQSGCSRKRAVICKLAMPDGAPKYSLARIEHHHHTVCVQCGAVGEFRHATIERLLRAVGQEIPGQIVGHRLEVFTVCADCG